MLSVKTERSNEADIAYIDWTYKNKIQGSLINAKDRHSLPVLCKWVC